MLLSVGTTCTIAQNNFLFGDRVKANTNNSLNVRSGAGVSYNLLFTALNGEIGTITGGPIYDGTTYYWYKVKWDKNSQEGWSYQEGLLKIVQIGTVTMVSPNGGENWAAGSTQNINWNKSGNIEHCELQYTIDNGANWSIINSNATSPFTWSIPIIINSTQCRVKVLGFYPGSDPVYSISANTFTISSSMPGTATKIKLKNIYVQQRGSNEFRPYPLRTALGIKAGDKIRFEGVVLDKNNNTVSNQNITVYNSLLYRTDQNNSKVNISSSSDGKFYYPSQTGGLNLINVEGGAYPFWFKVNNDIAIPYDLIIMDESTTIDGINNALKGLTPLVGTIKKVEVRPFIQKINELFIPAETYPLDDDNLANSSNNNFWHFYTNSYVGPVNEKFLINSNNQEGWLVNGFNLYQKSVKVAQDNLPDKFSAINNSMSTTNIILYSLFGIMCFDSYGLMCQPLFAKIETDVLKNVVLGDNLSSDEIKEFEIGWGVSSDAIVGFSSGTKEFIKHIPNFLNQKYLGNLSRVREIFNILGNFYKLSNKINDAWKLYNMNKKYYRNDMGEYKGCEYTNVIHISKSGVDEYYNLTFTNYSSPKLNINQTQFNTSMNPDWYIFKPS
jgi:hypothetical protein